MIGSKSEPTKSPFLRDFSPIRGSRRPVICAKCRFSMGKVSFGDSILGKVSNHLGEVSFSLTGMCEVSLPAENR